MAEGWMRAVAEVFVEVHAVGDEAEASPGERHLVAVSESSTKAVEQRSAVFGPRLVLVSLFGRPTGAELRAMVEATAHVAQSCMVRDGGAVGRVLVLGLEAQRRRRRSKAEIDFVDSDADRRNVFNRSPHVIVTDAAGFHEIPDQLLAGTVIVGLARGGDGPEYSQLFVKDAKARLPEATVSAGSIESLTASNTKARQLPRALGDALLQLIDSSA